MAPEPGMNVIEVIADQHQASCMGCEGREQVITPNMDRLAAEGVRFARAYTQNPICTPSRVSILSGQYCHNHGYYGLSGPRPRSLPSFFSHFGANGYKTAGIGNLHTPNDPRNWLEDHLTLFADCFSSVDGRAEETEWYDEIRKRGLLEKEDFHFFHNNRKYALEGMPSQLPFELSEEGWTVQKAIGFIDDCRGEPFCMQVSLERPHQPFFPDVRFWEMYPEDIDPPSTIHQDPSHRPPHFRITYENFRTKWDWPIEPDDFDGHASLGRQSQDALRRRFADQRMARHSIDHAPRSLPQS
ncbi:MAG: sulfatase-like hydrolase/transferase, partial [Theionarchaea archaeon]|nr:sulfatase-like hydrolase/transferase [Theionarchaea archaeon]